MRVIPGITKNDYARFNQWIEEEKEMEQRCVVNYKDNFSITRDKQQKKELNFNQIKDYLYIFTLMDRDNDGLLSLDDLKKSMGNVFTN